MNVTPRQARSIKAAGAMHPFNPKNGPPNIMPPIIVCGLTILFGAGAAAFLAWFMVCARPLVAVFTVTLGVATRLASFR
eukprot:COSAG02_NODE_49133_length_328_cov_69.384279_1_plen_78_part_10